MGEELFNVLNLNKEYESTNRVSNNEDLHNPLILTDRDSIGRELRPSVILEEFKGVYEDSLSRLEGNVSEDEKQHKLKLLTSWVTDLSEQNDILIRTVEQVEQEAADRVALLEDRLQKSSQIGAKYMAKFQDYNNEKEVIDGSKKYSSDLKMETAVRMEHSDHTERILKKRICNLQNDISGLLEIIRRARCYGSWDASGLNFLELTYEDIFG